MLKKKTYRLRLCDGAAFEIYDATGDLSLLRSQGVPFLPSTNRAANWGKPRVTMTTQGDTELMTIAMDSNCLYNDPQTILEFKEDHIEFYFKAKIKRRCALHKWNIFSRGSDIKALEVLNYRSHINSPSAYEVNQTILARRRLGMNGLDINTEDGDMMFAPHPMLFVFENMDDRMIIAPMELVAGESMHLRMYPGQTTVKDYYIRVGESLYWLEEGEELESPHFTIMLTKNMDGYQTISAYTDMLVREGRTRRKELEEIESWWLNPMWCSWGDQHTHLDSEEVVSTAFTQQMRQDAANAITPKLVDRVVETIEKYDLPIKTLILDDRWYTHWGEMKADASKFPDMRGYVDSLHEKGFKVMAWSSIWRFSEKSEIFKQHPEWFLVHHYTHDQHNADDTDIIALDFSNKEAADYYLNEVLERLLSDKPGCYNFDGIKVDWPFLMPHDYAYSDRNWVGKEKTIYNTQKLIYDKAKSIKKNALLIGVSPHPFFQDVQDIIRTYDVSTYDYGVHLERARYIKSLSPGMPVAMDEHVFYKHFFRYMEEASKVGIPMVYNLLRFNGDGHLYTEDDYRKLKAVLDNCMETEYRL